MSESITLELTLSRWHKVAERLASKANEAAAAATAAFCGQRVNGYAGEAQKSALSERAQEGVKALAEQEIALSALSAIRAALGRANAERGVSDLLARQESANRRLKLVREILAGQRPDMVFPDALETYKPFGETQQRYAYREEPQGAIAVRVLSRDLESKLRLEADALQASLHRLADEANDANAGKIRVSIPLEAARMAGAA